MDPAVTGLSRLEYGPEEIAQEAFVETPTVDDKTLIGSIARLHRMIAAWKADGAFNAQLGNIQAVRDAYAPDARDPIQIISTGRCGTTALSQFCQQQEGLAPFHSFELGVLAIDRNHLLYRLLTNALDNDVLLELTRQYLRNRTAELIWAYRQNCTPLISSHWDTIFAPAMVELFPGSRFIHLSRDPTDVFRSIYGKNQWQFAQLMPLRFDTDFPAGRFIARVDESLEIEERVAWYLHLTGVLCSALKTALSADRWLALKSEDLFAATPEAFEALGRIMPLDAAGSAAFQTHFDTPRNTKDELEDVERNDLNMRAIRIPALMSRLAASGRI